MRIEILTEEHLQQLFYFALKKTGDRDEAEELAQEIACAALYGLANDAPADFEPWLWGIARRRFAEWVRQRNSWRSRFESVEVCELPDLAQEPDEGFIQSEQQELLRRELALLAKEYREVTLAYYVQNKKISEIAYETGLPEGTIKHRLFVTRKNLREGMQMARTYGTRSFAPENIRFLISHDHPQENIPEGIVNRLIAKNILLEAYNNPSTKEELSLSLGIAMPYMECEIDALVESKLLYELDDRKYITDFIILDSPAQQELYDRTAETCKELAGYLTFFAINNSITFFLIEEKSLEKMKTIINDAGKKLLGEVFCDNAAPSLDEFDKTLLEEKFRDALLKWQKETGNLTGTGGQTLQETLWFSVPKTADDFIYLTFMKNRMKFGLSKDYKGLWDIVGFEDWVDSNPYLIGRDNNCIDNVANLVSYQYSGVLEISGELMRPENHELGLLIDIMKKGRPFNELTGFEQELVNKLVPRCAMRLYRTTDRACKTISRYGSIPGESSISPVYGWDNRKEYRR